MTTRTMVVLTPHWPLVAAGVDAATPAAVIQANRVLEVTPSARRHGVEVGMRRREAQGRCPSLEVIDHDPDLDARRFEPVVAALETFTPRIELLGPGRCSFPTRGPSRYFGGDEALATSVLMAVDAELAHVLGRADVAFGYSARVGVADGLFGASLAAELAVAARHVEQRSQVVPVDHSARFLDPVSVVALRRWSAPLRDGEHLVDVLWRLGLTTLGAVATVPESDLLARFGIDGARAHRLASGLDDRPPDTRPVPPESHVEAEFDPPAERVDAASFVAKTLADQLHARLAVDGLACTRVVVEAVTERGETLSRVWRHEGTLSAVDVADRVRWQLDGWLTSKRRPTSGIAVLRLIPDEVVADAGRQLGFWGGQRIETERAARALARVQGMLGPDAVTVPERRGGRGVAEQLGAVPLSFVDVSDEQRSIDAPSASAPWPGALPLPSPAMVFDDPRRIVVLDESDRPVAVGGRGDLSAAPVAVVDGQERHRITGWAGPWLIDERWWEPARRHRSARFQLTTDDGAAHLVSLSGGVWAIEASYD